MEIREFVKEVADYINEHKVIFRIDATARAVNDSDIEFYEETRIMNPIFTINTDCKYEFNKENVKDAAVQLVKGYKDEADQLIAYSKNIAEESFEDVKDRLYLKLVNQINADQYPDVVKINLNGNLMAIFPIVSKTGDSFFPLTQETAIIWGLTPKDIMQTALDNIRSSAAIAEVEGNYIYAATVLDRAFGASAILCKDMLAILCNQLQCNQIYIVPTSAYDTIIYPDYAVNDVRLDRMQTSLIMANNASDRHDPSFISDVLYGYDLEDDRIFALSFITGEREEEDINILI